MPLALWPVDKLHEETSTRLGKIPSLFDSRARGKRGAVQSDETERAVLSSNEAGIITVQPFCCGILDDQQLWRPPKQTHPHRLPQRNKCECETTNDEVGLTDRSTLTILNNGFERTIQCVAMPTHRRRHSWICRERIFIFAGATSRVIDTFMRQNTTQQDQQGDD